MIRQNRTWFNAFIKCKTGVASDMLPDTMAIEDT